MHNLLVFLATNTPTPSPSGTLRPGLSEDQVTPGLLGFLLTAFIVILTTFLIVDMVKRIRRVRYRGEVQEAREAELRGEQDAAASELGESPSSLKDPQA
ncbi:hypothetical protein ACQR35_07255 [Pseudarthrobacter sp. J1738]|uniref:hypothetical protein n=1 Tax=unclassified Pseudarthrobacter TaxID=2647000 RepID=UPI003D2B1867